MAQIVLVKFDKWKVLQREIEEIEEMMMLETAVGFLLFGTSFLIFLLVLVSLGGREARRHSSGLPGM